MKKKGKKTKNGKNFFKKKDKSYSIIPILFIIALISLFSETIRTVPAGAKSESFKNISFKIPNLNSPKLEKKIINNATSFIVKRNNAFLIEENIILDEELNLNKEDNIMLKEEVTVAKLIEKEEKKMIQKKKF